MSEIEKVSENGVTETARQKAAEVMEQIMVAGDLSRLKPEQRVQFIHKLCEQIGISPWSRPIDFFKGRSGQLIPYFNRDATDQLRKVHKVSIQIVERAVVGQIYVVTARATLPTGRQDESTGAVFMGAAYGDDLANLLMKAETKAKRRVTLSIVGLGFLTQDEVEDIPDAKYTIVDEGGPKRIQPAQPKSLPPPVASVKKAFDEIPSVTEAPSIPPAVAPQPIEDE